MQEEDGVASVSPIIQTEVVPWDTYVFLDSLSVTGTVIYSRVQKCPPLRLSIRVSNNIAPMISIIFLSCLWRNICYREETTMRFQERNSICINFVSIRCSFRQFF